ncbi:MAG: hypothetical protein IM638_04005 [Bacteroidetes bacterium]|nr:hypothetical protein [Bacteroidota bacterium]
MKYTVFLIAFAAATLGAAGCSKEVVNERKLGGVWEGEKVVYEFYANNAMVRDSSVANSGALYLWDDDELTNQAGSSLAIPLDMYGWEGNVGKMVSIGGYNIVKHNRRKLILARHYTDADLNIVRSEVFYFKRP